MRLRSFFLFTVFLACCGDGTAMKMSPFYSPHNAEREIRPSTDYIILHTTEAPKASALRKIRQNGEAHYVVDADGHIYHIIDRSRIAFHAGRSMWEGRTTLDNFSIGIEVVGYHDRDLSAAQYQALKELVGELQRIYRIPDERVITHSMVAYGAPNRWHPRSHRGRKRCAMNLATRSSRLKMDLTRAVACDPDVRAGRLVVGDPYLARVLYGNVEPPGPPSEKAATAESGPSLPPAEARGTSRGTGTRCSIRSTFCRAERCCAATRSRIGRGSRPEPAS
jgi:N-acetylmuramoyl-L-alanine amidase